MTGGLDAAARSAVERVLAGEARGAVLEADNLTLLRALPDDSVDLAYADPPFATGSPRRLQSIRLGAGERARPGFRGEPTSYEVTSDLAYDDGLPLGEHLAVLRERVVEIRRVLAPRGSLYLHCDWRTAHHVRVLLDEVFGAERFLNEIVWAYDYGGRSRDRWPRKHDTILWYAKGDAWTFERDAIDRIPYLAPGLVGPEKAARGKVPTDVWWMTIVPPGSRERTGYPTQKPVRLLERIVAASSRPGELVLDPYAGSGTTGVAAERLGRRWLLVDRNPAAVEIARRRLAEAENGGGEPEVIEAVTLDFGNTLVPVPAGALRGVVASTAGGMAARLGPFDADTVLEVWHQERERQFREEVPQFREVDMAERIVRILARLRGMPPPADGARWDDAAAARFSDPGEVAWAVEAYSTAFVDALEPAPAAGALIARLAATRRVAVLSNWPLAQTIDRYCEAAGWTPHLTAIVVSQRVGTIKPHPAIFAAARDALGRPPMDRILHVGDDWAADIVGAKQAGWRAAWLAARPDDSPLPGSERDTSVEADAVLARLEDLEEVVGRLDG